MITLTSNGTSPLTGSPSGMQASRWQRPSLVPLSPRAGSAFHHDCTLTYCRRSAYPAQLVGFGTGAACAAGTPATVIQNTNHAADVSDRNLTPVMGASRSHVEPTGGAGRRRDWPGAATARIRALALWYPFGFFRLMITSIPPLEVDPAVHRPRPGR